MVAMAALVLDAALFVPGSVSSGGGVGAASGVGGQDWAGWAGPVTGPGGSQKLYAYGSGCGRPCGRRRLVHDRRKPL